MTQAIPGSPPPSTLPAQDHAWDSARRQLGNGLLSIVMPAHNLAPSIAANIRHVCALFGGELPYEVIVVDDGSTDSTRDEIQKAEATMPKLRPVFLAHNVGKGAALKRGFEASRGTYILLLDGDLDLPPHQVSGFFRIMEEKKADAVIGSKLHRDSNVGSYPWHRRLTSLTYYVLVKMLVGLPVRDTQTGIKLFKRAALDWAFPRMLVKQFAFDLELLAIIHEKEFQVAESPITLRTEGTWRMPRPSAVRQVITDTLAVFYRLRLLRYYQTIRNTRMPEPPPLVSIVIAFPVPAPCLDECLAGIAEQSYTRYEVILLPDTPTGRAWPDKIREVPTGRLRPAEKRNLGIRQARGEIVAFIDDDAAPADNWLQQAVVYFSDDEIAAVGGPASTPANDPYLATLSGAVYANRLVSGNYRYRYVPTRVQEVDDFPSCNLFVRASALRALNGFRTDFWPGEDTQLCMEIVKRLQKTIIYDPRVHVFHHRRRLFLPHLRQIGRYALHRGYFARHFPSTSRKISYMLPSAFVVGLVGGALVAPFWPACRLLYVGALLVYAAITLASSINRNPLSWLLTWLGIVLTHIVYGSRFLVGFAIGRLPDEVHDFDHASQEDKKEQES